MNKVYEKELSIIIPFVQEWPQVAWTIMSIAEELRDRVDFEIIAVSNWCQEVKDQIANVWKKRGWPPGEPEPDRAHVQILGTSEREGVTHMFPWLKATEYTDKLSHWQAKNKGVRELSTGKFLMFIDAHCLPERDSIYKAFQYYKDNYESLNGTLHLPLTYHILEAHKLIYKLVVNWETAEIHYSFTGYRDEPKPYEVPCMSTCGMMMTRELYDEVGGWPTELGIYGGGENFMNFTLAVLGKKKWIMSGGALHHHGDNRKYHYYRDDYIRNRAIATYIFGGEDLARTMVFKTKGRSSVLTSIFNDVLNTCGEHRKLIKSKQIISIKDWVDRWQPN